MDVVDAEKAVLVDGGKIGPASSHSHRGHHLPYTSNYIESCRNDATSINVGFLQFAALDKKPKNKASCLADADLNQALLVWFKTQYSSQIDRTRHVAKYNQQCQVHALDKSGDLGRWLRLS